MLFLTLIWDKILQGIVDETLRKRLLTCPLTLCFIVTIALVIS